MGRASLSVATRIIDTPEYLSGNGYSQLKEVAMRRIFAVAMFATLLAACKGDTGPMGPEGPAGPPGPAGPGQVATHSGRLDLSGSGVWTLPAAAGNISNPPALSCYLSDSSDGPFLLVSTDTFSGVVCGLGQSGATLRAVIISSSSYSGWHYKFVAVYD